MHEAQEQAHAGASASKLLLYLMYTVMKRERCTGTTTSQQEADGGEGRFEEWDKTRRAWALHMPTSAYTACFAEEPQLASEMAGGKGCEPVREEGNAESYK